MWKFLINQFRFSALLIFAILVTGIFSLVFLPIEAMPEVKIPYASIVTMYPGASPVDVEELITNPIEEVVGNIEGVKMMSSSSVEGFSMIFLEFNMEEDLEEKVREMQTIVSKIAGQLPEDATSPEIAEMNYSNMPIFVLSLSADLSHTELVEIAEEVQSEILSVNGISDVDLIGVRPKQLNIDLDPTKLYQYNVSILELISVFQGAETNTPLGAIEAQDTQYTLRFESDLDLSEVENLIVRSAGDSNIYVRDLGKVTYDISEASQYSRISLNGSEPQNAISLNVYKKTGGNVVGIVKEINKNLDAMRDNTLKGVTLFTSVDYSQDIKDQLGSLGYSALQTILLVSFILFLSLGVREALVAGLAIPLTFLITFTGMSIMGNTLNFLSLFSLILALGILVDIGIVITEGMHTRLKEGKKPMEVALETVREYQIPLISGTLTTVAAFLPMLLMTGIIGNFIRHIPITVSLTLMASLFVGLGLLPVIGSRILKMEIAKKKTFLERFIDATRGKYKALLAWILERKKRQNFLIGLMMLLFIGTASFPVIGVLDVAMFPTADYRYFFIEVELSSGSLLEETNAVVEQIETSLLASPEVESFVAIVGSNSTNSEGGLGAATGNPNLANFTVNLVEERERSSVEIVNAFREEFSTIPNTTIDVIDVTDGPPSAAAIDFTITGSEFDQLKTYSDEAVSVLDNINGAININSSLSDTTNEFVFSVNRQKAASVGMTPSSLAQLARISVAGMTVSTIKIDGEDVNVILGTTANTQLDEILALPIVTQAGSFPLSYFVEVSFSPSPSSIGHIDGDRTVQITADLEPGYVTADVLADFQKNFNAVAMDDEYQVKYGGELEEIADSFRSLGSAMLLGILLIIVILVLQFNSYRQVGMVIFTIPLALIGVFTGLSFAGFPLSFPAFVGVVALAGIVVNNAIILIDRINKNRKEGLDDVEAILNATQSRFQPIILTSITTIVGIIPLMLSDPTWGPLGFTIISGLSFSTILTLFVVPATYKRFNK